MYKPLNHDYGSNRAATCWTKYSANNEVCITHDITNNVNDEAYLLSNKCILLEFKNE
jgi:hypothetical protein